MLILTRRTGESLKLDGDVTITVLGIGETQIKLGFTAPESVAIFREEVYQQREQIEIPDPAANEERMT